jgi:DNA-binding IclR family transcriptional regulator
MVRHCSRNIERLKKAQLAEPNIQVGSTLPCYGTSMGEVLLAGLAPAVAARHIPTICSASGRTRLPTATP